MVTTYERFPFHEPGSGPDTHLQSVPESSTTYKSLPHDGLRRPSMGKCLLQWFWSAWMIDGSKTQDRTDPSDCRHDNHHTRSRTSGTGVAQDSSSSSAQLRLGTQEQRDADTDEENPACRACRTWGVACDRQRPRCSHCLDQQILCFYVAPLRKTMKKNKSRSSRARTETPLRLQESCC